MKLIKIVYIKRLIEGLVEFVNTDYQNSANESESWLYRMLYDSDDNSDFNFYEQAKACFIDTKLSPKAIKTTIGWGKNVNGSPTIIIREVSRQKGSYDSIGGINGEIYLNGDKNYGVVQYRKTRKADYEIMVVSNNQLLTITITDILDALLTGAWESIVHEFNLFDYTIKDMMVNQDINTPLFIKSLNLSCQYENSIPSIIRDPNVQANTINFIITKLDNETLEL